MPKVLQSRQRDSNSERYARIWLTHTNEPSNSNAQVRNFTVFRSNPSQVRMLCLLSFYFLIALCCCSYCRRVTRVLKAGSWNT